MGDTVLRKGRACDALGGPVEERTRFIETYLTGLYTITELAERFGVSRHKLHKWLARHNVDGMKGLVDKDSRRIKGYATERVSHKAICGAAEGMGGERIMRRDQPAGRLRACRPPRPMTGVAP